MNGLTLFGTRRLAAAICLAFALPGLALAQERPDSLHMTCAQAAGIVTSQGAAVIGTGPSLYERYVTTQRFCSPSEYTEPAWVASSDQSRCFVGYVCKELSNDRD